MTPDRPGRLPGVVVAYDGTRESRPALSWAAAEAQRRRATLHVVAVADHGDVLRDVPAQLVRHWSEARAAASRLAHAGAALAATLVPGVHAEPLARVGPVTVVLAAVTRPGALLVVPPRLLTRAAERHADPGLPVPLAEQVRSMLVRRARGPVVLVGGGAGRAVGGPVVVGVDGSAEALGAAELAAALAAISRAPLRIVCAWSPPPPAPRPGDGWGSSHPGAGPRRHDPGSARAAGEVVAEATRRVLRLFPDLRTEPVVGTGRPDRVLARLSGEAALLVVGRRGIGTGHSLVLGSVSGRVLGLVGVPVALAAATPPGAVPRDVTVAAAPSASPPVLTIGPRLAVPPPPRQEAGPAVTA